MLATQKAIFGSGLVMSNNVHDFSSNPNRSVSFSAGGGDGGNLGERMVRLETHMQYLATKSDIESLKTEMEKIRTIFWRSLFFAIVGVASVTGLIIKLID